MNRFRETETCGPETTHPNPGEQKRPEGVFVTGTDTGVGKTVVSALLVAALRRRGIRAGYMKPVATGAEESNVLPEDLSFVHRVTGLEGSMDDRCPQRFADPLAPLVAARNQGSLVSLDRIRSAWARLRRQDPFLVVEGVGGVLVPLTPSSYMVLDLMEEMGYPVLVVARPSLGTINHTLLTLEAIQRRSLPLLGFVTSGKKDPWDQAAATSPAVIETCSGGVPFLGHVSFRPDPEQEIDSWIGDVEPVLEILRIRKNCDQTR